MTRGMVSRLPLPDYWEDYFDDVHTEMFFDHALEWIGERAENSGPVFAYLPTNAPHYPLWVPEEDRLELEAILPRTSTCQGVVWLAARDDACAESPSHAMLARWAVRARISSCTAGDNEVK